MNISLDSILPRSRANDQLLPPAPAAQFSTMSISTMSISTMSKMPKTEKEKDREKYLPALDENPANAEEAKETLERLRKLYSAANQLHHEAELTDEYNWRSPKASDLDVVIDFEEKIKNISKRMKELKDKWEI